MDFTLNIWVVLYSCGLVMGVFMALLFVFFHKRYAYHIHNITIVLLLMSLMLFSEIAEESNIVDTYPFLLGISPVLDLLIWPFLLFYIQFIVGKRNGYNWKVTLYFSPFLLALIWQIRFLTLPDANKLAYFSEGIPPDILILVTFKLICASSFLLYAHNIVRKALSKLNAVFSQSKKAKFLSRIRQSLAGISAIVMLIYLMFYIQYFEILAFGDSDRIGSLIISGFIYLLGALIFKNPQLFLEENYSNPVKNFFNGAESTYTERLLSLFDSKKLYLNERLTVGNVAGEMGLNEQQLSYLVNRQLGVTFLDFINTFRVKEVQGCIQRGEHRDKTLLGLALDSGFNSKASFNRIFKEHTGYSPSSYIKSLNK